MGLFSWLFGSNPVRPTSPDPNGIVDPLVVAQMGALGLALYAGYRWVKSNVGGKDDR
jgi:hypothetical protein